MSKLYGVSRLVSGLSKQVKRADLLAGEREALADVPNALGYQRILETSTNGYLVRQYLYSSLYDRLRCVS